MLEHPFARFEGQIQPVKLRIPLLQLVHHSQALQIVLKATVTTHTAVQRILPRMPKRRMPQIVRQRDGFHQVFVDAQ
ncbi:hypothetical protein D3C87_1891380 [compost metagenome]